MNLNRVPTAWVIFIIFAVFVVVPFTILGAQVPLNGLLAGNGSTEPTTSLGEVTPTGSTSSPNFESRHDSLESNTDSKQKFSEQKPSQYMSPIFQKAAHPPSAARMTAANRVGNLTWAVRLAVFQTKLQGVSITHGHQPKNVSSEALPALKTPNHTSPSAAAFALLSLYNVTPTAEQTAEIRSLDNLPASTRSAFTDYINAYLVHYRVSMEAYSDGHLSSVKPNSSGTMVRKQVVGKRTPPAAGSARHGRATNITQQQNWPSKVTDSEEYLTDMRRMLAGRILLLNATDALWEAYGRSLSVHFSQTSSHGRPVESVRIIGVLSIAPFKHDNIYTHEYALQFDRGGNDTYNNNAGGTEYWDTEAFFQNGTQPGPIRAAALIDMGGKDTYKGVNGGGGLGSGFLVDTDGDDIYRGGSFGTNGGGSAGAGFLLDLKGNDLYTAGKFGTNGGASGGVGLLVDTRGDDVYTAGGRGANGGGSSGIGLLYDANGTDLYTDKLAACSDCTIIPKGNFGSQIDQTYPVNPPPTNMPSTPGTPTPTRTPTSTQTPMQTLSATATNSLDETNGRERSDQEGRAETQTVEATRITTPSDSTNPTKPSVTTDTQRGRLSSPSPTQTFRQAPVNPTAPKQSPTRTDTGSSPTAAVVDGFLSVLEGMSVAIGSAINKVWDALSELLV